MAAAEHVLAVRPPFAWRELLGWLAARAIPGVEAVDETTYRRTTATGVVVLSPADDRVVLTASPPDADAAARARALLDLDADPAAIDAALARDPRLAALVAARPGLRVPGAWDGFELAVRAVLGQQISVVAASGLAGRVVADHGTPLEVPAGPLTHRFPAAATLAEAELPYMPASRARALRALAGAVASGELALGPAADPAATSAALLRLPGIGPWTAGYVVMRALRDPDAFPASDLVLRRALDGEPALPERWRPYRAYAAMHLWAGSAGGG